SALSDTAAYMDGSVPRIARTVLGVAVWPVVYAIAVGSTLWAFTHRAELTKLDTNKLNLPQSMSAMRSAVTSLLGLLVVYFLPTLCTRRRPGAWRVVETPTRLNARLVPLLALPFLPALLVPAVERDSPKLTFFFIAIIATIAVKSAYTWSSPAP